MMLLRLAWRNVWRNRRRSLIVLASIVVGMTAIVFTEALMRGFLRQAFENQLSAHTGHLQIHATGYQKNPTVERFMTEPRRAELALRQDARIEMFSRRVLVSGLLSSARNSSGVTFVGIEPERERELTTIAASVFAGRYLGTELREILISDRLATALDVRLGDKVVAMSSRRDGTVGSELFRIVGLYRTADAGFDRMHAYVPMESARTLVQAEGQLAELVARVIDTDQALAVRADLRSRLGPEYEVLTYHDIIPTLLMQLEMSGQMMIFFYMIIGLAMIFGIINTMMMSVFERIHEFGVLKSVGMRDRLVFGMILLEATLLGVCGAGSGALLGTAITLPLSRSGLNFAWFSEGLTAWGLGSVIYPQLNAGGILAGALVIILFCQLAALLPALRAFRLQPISAVRAI